MTFSKIATALLVVGLLGLQLVAVLFYLRHWGLRQTRISGMPCHEGMYFKRYVPPALRPRCDQERRKQSRRRSMRTFALKSAVASTIIAGVLAVAAFAGITAWPHVTWVDLTPTEIARLDYTPHEWVREPEQTLPALDEVLGALRERGVALVQAPVPYAAGDGMTAIAAEQWKQFFSRHRVPVRQCSPPVARCGPTRIKLILPGRWDRTILERLLEQGSALLLYGPPLQTVADRRPVQLYGLRFAPQRFSALPDLALVGDRTLTLGFDAGLALPMQRAFKGYVATSSDPQAVAFDDSHFIGGDLHTRLFAQRVANGRFVWMDFSPNAADHHPVLDERYLDAIVAAVFGYLLEREYVAWATWPEGRRFAGMLSVDAEDRFARVSMIAEVAREKDAPITWFVLSNEAQRHRKRLRELVEVGEIACHGDSHAAFPLVSAKTQVARIARCRKALSELTDVNVLAFRPPYEDYNDATVDAVANNGMNHYMAAAGADRGVPVIERSRTTGKTLVSIPRIGSDDFELWDARRLDVPATIEQANHEFAWADTLRALLVFDFHTQFITPERMQVVRHYAKRFKRSDVYLATAQELADWWRLRDRLIRGESISAAEGCRFQPVLLRRERTGELQSLKAPSAIAAVLPSHGIAGNPQWSAQERFCERQHRTAFEHAR